MKAAAFVLSVLTLNVAGPRRVHQGWQTRREALAASIKAENPGAAAFQEVWRPEDAEALGAAAGHPARAHEPSLGLAVTSRLPLLDRATLDLGGGFGALRAGLDAGGGRAADVYSARLDPSDAPRRVGQLLALADFVRAQSKDRAFVLLGDLAAASDGKEAELFLDLLGARDLCVSHGDEMCGRTLEDRRVDYALIPYSSRPPAETARAVFTGARAEDDDAPPLSAHFGLAARLEPRWLSSRPAAEPDGRLEALAAAADYLDAARADADARSRASGWLPWRGAWAARRARAEASRLAADAERARTALARAAKPAVPAWE
ncbi:MAG: endonuclease/exonuclease/phosphatase family protein [Elusimicrobiota bacterium]|nr:MAG: endonuclease/exonuclease/phosphatase family protein [Elusimicrobiota bacterium]